MRTEEIVARILTVYGNADKAIQNGRYSSALLQYTKAQELLTDTLPASEPFDRNVFRASCLAGSAAACVELDMNEPALECADVAISFYDRHGSMYPAEYGKWLLAILSKGVALAAMGRRSEAERQMSRAKKMRQSALAQGAGARRLQDPIRRCTEKLDHLLRYDTQIHKKRWWEFWRN